MTVCTGWTNITIIVNLNILFCNNTIQHYSNIQADNRINGSTNTTITIKNLENIIKRS